MLFEVTMSAYGTMVFIQAWKVDKTKLIPMFI